MFFNRKKPLVGLDIGSSAVKAIELTKSKSGYEITGFGRAPLGPDVVVDGAITDSLKVSETIKTVFESASPKTKLVATGVSGHSVIVKRVVLPVDTAEEVAGQIEFDADQYIPFEIAEVNLDFKVIGPSDSDEGGMEVLLVAVKKDQIQNHTDVIAVAGRTPQGRRHRCIRSPECVRGQLRSRCWGHNRAAKHRCLADEHQHHERRHAAVHPRRFRRR